MKCIHKDEAGNRLFEENTKKFKTYSAKNAKGELMSDNGLKSMLKEVGLSKKFDVEEYQGTKLKD